MTDGDLPADGRTRYTYGKRRDDAFTGRQTIVDVQGIAARLNYTFIPSNTVLMFSSYCTFFWDFLFSHVPAPTLKCRYQHLGGPSMPVDTSTHSILDMNYKFSCMDL